MTKAMLGPPGGAPRPTIDATMIIGNGLLAQALHPFFFASPDVLMFASGVSNSTEVREEAFERERDLLDSVLNCGAKIHYFSTCSVYDQDQMNTPYVRHKQHMEKLVTASGRENVIWRLPQLVGKTENPNTLTNFLFRHIRSGAPFRIWRHARRNLIDAEHVAKLVAHVVGSRDMDGCVLDLVSPLSSPILEIVGILEYVLDRKANYSLEERGGGISRDPSFTVAEGAKIGIHFGEDYVVNLVRKYYE